MLLIDSTVGSGWLVRRTTRKRQEDGNMVFSRLITFCTICLPGVWLSAKAQSPSSVAPLSTDSAVIAFASHRDSNWEIYVMDAAGRSQKRLTRRDAEDRFPLW